MWIKTAREDLGQVLRDLDAEQRENIKIAAHNANCPPETPLTPYRSEAFIRLIKMAGELIELVEPNETG